MKKSINLQKIKISADIRIKIQKINFFFPKSSKYQLECSPRLWQFCKNAQNSGFGFLSQSFRRTKPTFRLSLPFLPEIQTCLHADSLSSLTNYPYP